MRMCVLLCNRIWIYYLIFKGVLMLNERQESKKYVFQYQNRLSEVLLIYFYSSFIKSEQLFIYGKL
jgi:hypothetical protein